MSLSTHINKEVATDKIGILLIAATPILALVLTFIPLSSNANIDLPFLAQSQAKKVLVFGGFPSCASTCPVSLSKLRNTYEDYTELSKQDDLAVFFVNIQLDTPAEISDAYAKSFHQDFESYSISRAEAEHFYRSISMETFSGEQSQAKHNSYIYLFSLNNQQWKLKRVFNDKVTPEKILKQLLQKPA